MTLELLERPIITILDAFSPPTGPHQDTEPEEAPAEEEEEK